MQHCQLKLASSSRVEQWSRSNARANLKRRVSCNIVAQLGAGRQGTVGGGGGLALRGISTTSRAQGAYLISINMTGASPYLFIWRDVRLASPPWGLLASYVGFSTPTASPAPLHRPIPVTAPLAAAGHKNSRSSTGDKEPIRSSHELLLFDRQFFFWKSPHLQISPFCVVQCNRVETLPMFATLDHGQNPVTLVQSGVQNRKHRPPVGSLPRKFWEFCERTAAAAAAATAAAMTQRRS